MKKYICILLFSALLVEPGCRRGGNDDYDRDDSGAETVSHEMIVLGDRLEDPYSVANVTKALGNLYPTKAGRTEIKATDQYVRFLPKDEDQFDTLLAMGLDLMDHPLDYQILRDGDYYHDPAVPEDEITWQYCVVPADFVFPEGIRCEILDECYIPTADMGTKADGVDWDAVEREAYRITGNSEMLAPQTRGREHFNPSGRITIVDDLYGDGTPMGVAGVKVICNTFVKFSMAYTDRDGYYEIPKKYSSRVRYRLMFSNRMGFNIGFNLVLVPASTSALGKGSPEGIDYTVTRDSERKLFVRSAVNNAAYDYFTRCGEDDMDIGAPPKNLRIWLFRKMVSSSAPMLRQGTVLENDIIRQYLGNYAGLVKIFLPDITLGVEECEDYSSLYLITTHELAHASHFAKVGKEYWNDYIKYIITSYITTMGQNYGDGTGSGAGKCEVGEMWAYFMENSMYQDRYGGSMPTFGNNFWFHPQILAYIYERGVSRSEMFRALDRDVCDRDAFRRKLSEICPDKESAIEMAFGRY